MQSPLEAVAVAIWSSQNPDKAVDPWFRHCIPEARAAIRALAENISEEMVERAGEAYWAKTWLKGSNAECMTAGISAALLAALTEDKR